MPRHEPTTAELKDAFKRSGLWRWGWTYDQAIDVRAIRFSLQCEARAFHARHTRAGRPPPAQADLLREPS